MDSLDEKLIENFRIYDECMRKWNIKPARYENCHFSELGKNALPHMKERGIEYISLSLKLDTGWLDVPRNKPALHPPGPYHHLGFYYDCLEDDMDFFILRSKLNKWRFDSPQFVPEVDFLWDNTIFWDENKFNDVDAAANVGIKQIRRGVDSRFFGTLLCHEQRIAVLSMSDWEKIFKCIYNGLKKYHLIYRPFDYICDYIKSFHNSRVTSVMVNEQSGKVNCKLEGKTIVATVLEIYTDEADTVSLQTSNVPAYTGSISVDCQCAGTK